MPNAWVDQQGINPTWSSTGGLSLSIEIPAKGQQLRFSKIGGEPKLAFNVRPHETLKLAMGMIWAAIWSAILVAIIATLSRPQSVGFLGRRAPWILTGLGLLLFIMVPTQLALSVTGLVAFILGALWIAIQQTFRITRA